MEQRGLAITGENSQSFIGKSMCKDEYSNLRFCNHMVTLNLYTDSIGVGAER